MENKMTESDYQFHGNMSLVPQVGYCSSTDNQWKRTEKKKFEVEEQLQKRREMVINIRAYFCLYPASMQYLTLLMEKVTK